MRSRMRTALLTAAATAAATSPPRHCAGQPRIKVPGAEQQKAACTYGDRVRPILPCARHAFVAMTAWVERDRRPPGSRTIGRPAAGVDATNSCALR